MKRGVFYPYTKVQAIKILREYFNITKKEAEEECFKLAYCALSDGLSVNVYFQDWSSKLSAGKKGNINELYKVYQYRIDKLRR